MVEEELGFAPAGEGQHLLVRVRKVNANTAWVAEELARFARCAPRDVGYAGLKDRRAVTVQWFSLPRPRETLDWSKLQAQGVEVLEAHPHNRKLPRGALSGNRFTIRLRPAAGSAAALLESLEPRLAAIARDGVPNYFGPQRFGREGSNLDRTAAELRTMRPGERGFVLSAARSVIFNAVLAQRVANGTWQKILAGDLANLEGRGSFFAVDAVDAVLEERSGRLEIHPTGPLWGEGEPASAGAVQALEIETAAGFPQECALCTGAHMEQERRSLRLAVHELSSTAEEDAAVLHFRLGRGSYATAVLAELIGTVEQAADA